MEHITKRQEEMLSYIQKVIKERSTAPSVREIGEAVRLSSTSSVQYNLNALEKAGYIERDPNLKRTIRLTTGGVSVNEVPLIGTVTAGLPILAVEEIEGYIPISADISSADNLFALRVKGDSMINAAILDGDIIVVEQTPVANNGDIVVALINDEATVKRFYKENGHYRLQPENENYKPIIVPELSILGKVITVIRRY